MKILKKILFISLLLIIYIYTCYIAFLPSNFIIMQGESLKINTLFGVNILPINSKEYEAIQTVSTNGQTKIEQVGKLDFDISIFDILKVKKVSVNVIPKTTVIPAGNAIGMKLYTDGVLVVGMSEIEGKKPYENTGIKEGDRIVQINENSIMNTSDLMQQVNLSNGESLNIKYIRNDETITTSIKPIKNSNNEYKIGLWVRDAAAGVGTLTFYEPSTKMFACLGHGILDIDTQELIKIANGELVTTNILNIQKGKKGVPRRN